VKYRNVNAWIVKQGERIVQRLGGAPKYSAKLVVFIYWKIYQIESLFIMFTAEICIQKPPNPILNKKMSSANSSLHKSCWLELHWILFIFLINNECSQRSSQWYVFSWPFPYIGKIWFYCYTSMAFRDELHGDGFAAMIFELWSFQLMAEW